MHIADLHIHSKYSRATSRDCDAPHLDQWARNKGIQIVGTGDFTHPGWRKELREALVPGGDGLYALREELRLPAGVAEGGAAPRFVLSGEISTIYKKNGKTRKVHHVILLPSLEAAEALAHRLEAVGNLHSDGRPILGLDSRDLLEITLEACSEAVYIPAHIWTPHFSLFGAFSGFDTLEECYEDLSPYVHALETGLSSDPVMNRRISALDRYTLVSNSDAHSPAKLGREANLLDIDLSYAAMARAIETGEGFGGTLEFFPEEGKYHLDGHRNCEVCLEPAQTLELDGRCPVCGKKLTIGVLHRVEELADRADAMDTPANRPFFSLIPLPELIASCTGVSTASKKTQARYFDLLSKLGPELSILREMPVDVIEKAAGYAIGEGIRRMRAGEVRRRSGFDGEYGVISLFDPQELETLRGQISMLPPEKASRPQAVSYSGISSAPQPQAEVAFTMAAGGLNEQQRLAATTWEPRVAVVAGPGTGKTKTLVARIAHLIEDRGVSPVDITAVSFTRQAAAEMRERLEERLGKKALAGLTAGTFHSICMGLIPPKALVGEGQAMDILRELLADKGSEAAPLSALRKISLVKNGQSCLDVGLEEALYQAYCARLKALNLRDLDDLLLEALAQPAAARRMFTHLLVDEFQDINGVQRQLVRHWHTHGQSLFVIGDPDQSIYGFRGANAQCFAELAKDIPGLQTISLQENYRSAPAILQSALAVISHNPGEPRALLPNRPKGAPVRLMKAQKLFDQHVWIAKEIGRMVGGVDMLSATASGKGRHAHAAFSDIAVLCRTRRQLEQIEACLLHDDIPCQIYGREDYLHNKKVLATLGFFGSLLHPGDAAALADCLRIQWRVPQPLRQRAADAMAAAAEKTGLNAARLRAELGSYEPLQPWLEAVDAFLPRIMVEKPRLLLQDWVDRYEKNAAMERLLQASVFHGSMEGLWQTLLLGQESDIRRTGGKAYAQDAIRLMTLHGSKGLEFPIVFLVCDHMGTGEAALEEIQEERRLFFVGMTRAREELILTSAEEEACFLAELPAAVQVKAIPRRNAPVQAEQLRLF